MDYIKDNARQHISTIRAAHPNMSIPDGADLSDLGYTQLEPTPQPEAGYGYAVQGGWDEYEPGRFRETWTVISLPLDGLKADKLQAVQAEKVRARDAGFLVADTLFDSDLSARTSYTELGLRLSQNPSFTTQWKASAGQWVLMDAALYSQVVIAGEAHITAVFAWQATKEMEIGACETVEELEAVDITYS